MTNKDVERLITVDEADLTAEAKIINSAEAGDGEARGCSRDVKRCVFCGKPLDEENELFLRCSLTKISIGRTESASIRVSFCKDCEEMKRREDLRVGRIRKRYFAWVTVVMGVVFLLFSGLTCFFLEIFGWMVALLLSRHFVPAPEYSRHLEDIPAVAVLRTSGFGWGSFKIVNHVPGL